MDIAYGQPYFLQRTQTAPIGNTIGAGGDFGRGAGAKTSSASAANVNHHSMNSTGHHQSTSASGMALSSLAHSQAHTSSNYSIQSQRSTGTGSRSSDTTQGTAHSTLFTPPVPQMPRDAAAGQMSGGGGAGSNGNAGGGDGGAGDVTATNNVMNSVADASSSLFQICVTLRERLQVVPGVPEAIQEEQDNTGDDWDPVTVLWRTFMRGLPLLHIYNALRPPQPLSLGPGVREDKRSKAAVFKFLQACIHDLKFPAEECFIVTDIYSNDTTGFTKVARVVNRILDLCVQRGLIEDKKPTASDFAEAEKGMKKSQRQHIISELVATERTYVQHLELLQKFKHLVEERGVINGDAAHAIFLNLNALLDFQRRFLIRVEQTNAQPEQEQNWGRTFMMYIDAFKVYEPYIANQRKCERTVVAEFPKLAAAGGTQEIKSMVESPTTLYGFLMKPFQRLSKYPLLLEDLYKKGDLTDEKKKDLLVGKAAATDVLTRTNQVMDREEKAEAVQELKMRVEDWKGHRVEGFGELLLYGTFTVLKSETVGAGKDGERQVSAHLVLFIYTWVGS